MLFDSGWQILGLLFAGALDQIYSGLMAQTERSEGSRFRFSRFPPVPEIVTHFPIEQGCWTPVLPLLFALVFGFSSAQVARDQFLPTLLRRLLLSADAGFFY